MLKKSHFPTEIKFYLSGTFIFLFVCFLSENRNSWSSLRFMILLPVFLWVNSRISGMR